MTDQTLSASLNTAKTHPFGIRLKSAREAIGMDRKDAALQLRLHEKMIVMIESGEYKTDIPMTFIRGYIRSYCKLLGIPEGEIHEAMESMQP
jgi:cytoskeleton protein RodZ